MADVGQDVRVALRVLRKSPVFAGVAILCLALGIGANAAIFSVVDAVLLRPLPYAEPGRLVRLYETMPSRGPGWKGAVSWPNYRDWMEQVPGFEGLAAYIPQGRNLSGEQGAERLKAVAVTANFFQVLGVSPKLGRGFAAGEDAPGTAPVVVVSEGLWRRRFGADPGLVGRTLTLDGQPHTVIGILADAARFPVGTQAELFVPLVPTETLAADRGSQFLLLIGRLRPAVTLEAANAELRQVAQRIGEAHPGQAGRSASALLLSETVVGPVRPALLILQVAVVLVLLIACANVANLLLARAAMRRQEMAVRLALGASRARLVRQMLVESLLLALAGALFGLLLASWGLDVLGSLVQRALPMASDVSLQGRVLGFSLGVTVTSALLFGIAPALQASRQELASVLAEAGTKTSASRSSQRFRGGLVVAEIALSLILLVGAGLLLRGFANLMGTEPGLDARNVLTAHLPVPSGKYAPGQVSERLFLPVLERVRALPGVRAAALISLLPIQGAWTNRDYSVEGEPLPDPSKKPIAEYRFTSPDFFKSLGMPLLAGRDFTDEDGRREDRVVIINQTLAQRHFKGQDAVGRRLLLGRQPVTIIGVVGDVRQAGLEQAPLAEIHIPYNAAAADSLREVTLVLKTAVSPMSVTSALREAVRAVDGDQPIDEVLTMEDVIERSVAGRRLNLVLLGTFALCALVLAAAGLYGVISYLVVQRTREIGIRMALGAQTRDVVRLVVRQGMLLAAVGIGLGFMGALGLSRSLESMLFGVSERDPLTFGGLAVLLGGIALLASWLPARRAASVDPVIAMRDE